MSSRGYVMKVHARGTVIRRSFLPAPPPDYLTRSDLQMLYPISIDMGVPLITYRGSGECFRLLVVVALEACVHRPTKLAASLALTSY